MLSTAVRNAISSITYPIRHEFVRTSPDLSGADTDLVTYGDWNAHVLVTGLAERVFSSHNHGHDYSDLIGRVMQVRPSRPNGEQWYMSADDNGGNGAYVTGPRVCPELVNGRVYQELRDIGGNDQSSPFLLRYNDEAHRDDRANANNPWTIVWAVDGLAHQVGRPRVTPPVAWVEVVWPLSPVTTGVAEATLTNLATDEDIDLIFSEPIVRTGISNNVMGHTLGKAVVETEGDHSGAVILDPPRVEGELYLTWYDGHEYYSDHVFVQVAGLNNTTTPVGYFNRAVNGNVYYNDDVYTTVPVPRLGSGDRTMHWAKLNMELPAPSPDAETRRTALIEEATTAHEAFEDLNDALNDLARYQSWCSEYERTMQFIGMRDRRSGARQPFDIENVGTITAAERHAWDVEYDVDLTITDDSLSYRVSNMLESEYSVGSVSDLRFDASVTVTIRGVVAPTADEAEELVSRSQIDDELDSMIGGSFDINDYSHSDTNEDTDFDWEEYDENN